MIIGVDAGCLGIKDKRLAVGVYQVAKNLFEKLCKVDKKNTYYLYSFYPIEQKLMQSFCPNMKNILVTPTRGWMKAWLPLRIAKDKPDIFLALNHTLPTRVPFTKKYKTIALFHDIAFEKFPDMYPGSRAKLSRESKKTAQRADKIIAVSKATKKDLQEIYAVSPKKIIVVYEGIRVLPKGKKEVHKNPYFLFVGAMKQQKNIPTLLKAFHLFCQKNTNAANLYLVGGDKWMDEQIKKVYTSFPENIKKRIQFLGIVNDKQLANFYTNALAFVSPSYYEGFGLPFVEAMSCGCPVIGSTQGALPEIIGDAGILVDPSDKSALAKMMEKVFLNKKQRERMKIKGLEKAKHYSWELFAKQIFSIIAQYETEEKGSNRTR